MEISFFLFNILFIQTNLEIKVNPIFLIEKQYPYILSTNDNGYYYLVAKDINLKIDKESGSIVSESENNFRVLYNDLYIADNQYNNYLYSHTLKNYYHIIYNPQINFQETNIVAQLDQDLDSLTLVGSIPQNNDFIIYGYTTDYLLFLRQSQIHPATAQIICIGNHLSCKFINDDKYICTMIINNNLVIYLFNYAPGDTMLVILDAYNSFRFLDYENSGMAVLSIGLYDTDNSNIKLLCFNIISDNGLKCLFLNIYSINQIAKIGQYLYFEESSDFSEKNCYLSQFNSEYLFCCAIQNYIQCFRINLDSFFIIKDFKILQNGANTHLTIKSNNDYVTIFYNNHNNFVNYIYEYYIYLPTCQDKEYSIT